MRSSLAWLHIRVNAWKYDDGSLPPSPTRIRRKQAEAERERLIAQQKQILEEMSRPKVVPVRGMSQVRLMREYLKVKRFKGAVEAARLYPEQAIMLKN